MVAIQAQPPASREVRADTGKNFQVPLQWESVSANFPNHRGDVRLVLSVLTPNRKMIPLRPPYDKRWGFHSKKPGNSKASLNSGLFIAKKPGFRAVEFCDFVDRADFPLSDVLFEKTVNRE